MTKLLDSTQKIKIAIVGVGNCASSLVQGVEYYTDFPEKESGLMKANIGGYTAANIEFVCAFDIDERKINRPLKEAIFAKPNCTLVLYDNIKTKAPVFAAPVLDGYASHMDSYPEENRFLVSKESIVKYDLGIERTMEGMEKKLLKGTEDVVKILKDYQVDILINYCPVGSQIATEFYAECALEANVAFLNCIPVFIASNPEWEQKFIDKGLPLIGDDMRSQFGASIISQALQELAFNRGHKVKCHIQRNVGGNTDFLNMEDKGRLKSKKESKENVIRAQNDIRGISTEDTFLHAGPSEYISFYKDNKVANFHLELEGFMGSPVILDAQLSVIDSPNSAGVVIDAIRYLQTAREMGIVGALRGPSAFTQKTPPMQMTMETAMVECEELARRRFTRITEQQLIPAMAGKIF